LWTARLFKPRRHFISFDRPIKTVVEVMSDSVQSVFPSPRGVPIVAGRFKGENPVRIWIRSFPNGARVGQIFRRDRGDWTNPWLVGELVGGDSATDLTFKISSLGGVYVYPLLLLVALGLLGGSIAQFVSGSTAIAVPLLCISVIFGLSSFLFAMTSGGEMRKEQLLHQWLGSLSQKINLKDADE
jgi:hypothetical protein